MFFYFIYLLGGAGVFYALEYKREEAQCLETKLAITDILQTFENSTSKNTGGHINKTDLNELIRVT